MVYNPIASVELFHLIFLDQLGRKLDKRLYALKGGCNLRFFLGSIRYSQDIDIDVKTVRRATLQKTVSHILESPAMGSMLRTHSITIGQISDSKQTETTQRWKIQLKTASGSIFPTKIEFSRRDLEDPVDFDSISPSVLSAYHLHPIFAPHYGPSVAFEQKIKALSLRKETQARDIWDLFHLMNAYNIKNIDKEHIVSACTNAATIHFSDFKDQVIAFFPADLQKQYDQKTWETIQLKVIEYLESL